MPRTLAQNAQYINETIKPAIKSAIEAQGVTVPSTDSFLDYADRIGEIEGGGSGYQLKDLPTGSISTVTDAAELPLNALKVSVEAVQSGSGIPSPSNIRPISGWDSGEITDHGLNVIDNTSHSWNINASGKIVAGSAYEAYVAPVIQGKQYLFSCENELPNILVYAFFENEPAQNEFSYNGQRIVEEEGADHFLTVAPITGYICVRTHQNSTTNRIFAEGKQYTINFPTTIYGAEWDVINGELGLKITDGFYESYNSEVLPGIWMSDRDVYQEGITPTIGAQVKYKLATPTYITLTGLSIRLLEGTNNLYADCGEVIEGEYFSGSAKGYVDGIKYANEGDGGIASYTNVKEADELLGASAITFEVYARIDSYVSKTSGAYARLIEFGNSQQTGRLGFIGLASDNDNNLCYWDDVADIASGIDTWTLGDTHLISVVKTTSGSLKIYVDGVLKYTGSSTLTITTSIIDYVTERGGYSSQVDSARQLNGEVYAWRVYAKELSAANIAQNLAADRSLYSR